MNDDLITATVLIAILAVGIIGLVPLAFQTGAIVAPLGAGQQQCVCTIQTLDYNGNAVGEIRQSLGIGVEEGITDAECMNRCQDQFSSPFQNVTGKLE